MFDSLLHIHSSIYINNTVSVAGGVLYAQTSSFAITNSDFANNHAMNNGGALYYVYANSTVHIHNRTFKSNSVEKFFGGAITVFESTDLTISTSSFIANSATDAGVLFTGLNTLSVIANSMFTNNSVTKNGGVLHTKGSYLIIIN